MLVSEGEARARLALAICFVALAADRLLLVTFELPLTACQAIQILVVSGARNAKSRQTSQYGTSWLEDFG